MDGGELRIALAGVPLLRGAPVLMPLALVEYIGEALHRLVEADADVRLAPLAALGNAHPGGAVASVILHAHMQTRCCISCQPRV